MSRVCILTGGSSGIGRAAATLLSQEGYTVYELSRSGADFGAVRHITADVTDPEQVRSAIERVAADEGTIDLLVNNAGFGISGAAEFTDPAEAHAQLDVCFFGALHCIQAALPYLRRCGGRIVNVSSVAGAIAIPFQAFYSASKAAINSLTLALRNELSPFGVGVCAVLPGDTHTGFTAVRRKSEAGADIYGDSLRRAVATMERDEQNGVPPSHVARVILRAAKARRPRAFYVVGLPYRLLTLLYKLLPATLGNAIVGMIYR